MEKNSKLRNAALDALSGNWGTAVLMTIVYYAVSMILVYSFTAAFSAFSQAMEMLGNLSNILILPLTFALYVAFLRMKRKEEPGVQSLFAFYTNKKVWAVELLKNIYIILWTLLLIVPGIVKSYSYAMTEYILFDNPNIGAEEAINRSMVMMKGKKLKLFLLDLSFIGWFILALLTLGIGFVLLVPYIYTAHAAFYEDLKAELASQATPNEDFQPQQNPPYAETENRQETQDVVTGQQADTPQGGNNALSYDRTPY